MTSEQAWETPNFLQAQIINRRPGHTGQEPRETMSCFLTIKLLLREECVYVFVLLEPASTDHNMQRGPPSTHTASMFGS